MLLIIDDNASDWVVHTQTTKRAERYTLYVGATSADAALADLPPGSRRASDPAGNNLVDTGEHPDLRLPEPILPVTSQDGLRSKPGAAPRKDDQEAEFSALGANVTSQSVKSANQTVGWLRVNLRPFLYHFNPCNMDRFNPSAAEHREPHWRYQFDCQTAPDGATHTLLQLGMTLPRDGLYQIRDLRHWAGSAIDDVFQTKILDDLRQQADTPEDDVWPDRIGYHISGNPDLYFRHGPTFPLALRQKFGPEYRAYDPRYLVAQTLGDTAPMIRGLVELSVDGIRSGQIPSGETIELRPPDRKDWLQ